jgi:hypothetical protein
MGFASIYPCNVLCALKNFPQNVYINALASYEKRIAAGSLHGNQFRLFTILKCLDLFIFAA